MATFLNNPEWVEVNKKRYKINTDFRIAIECQKIAEDTTIGDFQRAMGILYKLYGEEALKEEILGQEQVLEKINESSLFE